MNYYERSIHHLIVGCLKGDPESVETLCRGLLDVISKSPKSELGNSEPSDFFELVTSGLDLAVGVDESILRVDGDVVTRNIFLTTSGKLNIQILHGEDRVEGGADEVKPSALDQPAGKESVMRQLKGETP